MKENNEFVYPQDWQKITQQYPNNLEPRQIFSSNGRWLWQASSSNQIDITNWKIHWDLPDRQVLATMGEFTNSEF